MEAPKGFFKTITICAVLFMGLCVYLLNEQEHQYTRPEPAPPERDRGPVPVGLVLFPVGAVMLPAIVRYFRSKRQQGIYFRQTVPVAYYQTAIRAKSARARIARKPAAALLVQFFHWYTNGYYKRG